MKALLLIILVQVLITVTVQAQGEAFSKTVINTGYSFRHPFDMFQGPDDSLWVNERGGVIYKVHKSNGGRRLVLDISASVTFTVSGTSIQQDGMFGMALHPDAMKGLGKDSLYVAYCYNGSAARRTKIVKYYCNPANNILTNATDLVIGLPGSNDHNGGKLVFGPDKKIYYSCGDQGANQFGNACQTLKSQLNPSSTTDFVNYAGHILRINTDGSIPTDNPTFGGVRSHVYSKGHRNPQGLVWQKNVFGQIPSNGLLFESEQGAVSDDEVNIIESGKNYGWPYIAGYNDNLWYTYKNWSLSPVTPSTTDVDCGNYGSECGTATNMTGGSPVNPPRAENYFIPANGFTETFTNPIKSQAPDNDPVANGGCGDYLVRKTVAFSSIEYYNPTTGIPGWSNSLLLTTLKNSSVIRYKLNATGTGILSYVNDTIQYFRSSTAINRFRDIVVGSDGITLFVVTDSVGATSGVTAGGGVSGTGGTLTDRGKLIAFRYTGTAIVLSLPDNTTTPTTIRNDLVKNYPNPANDKLYIDTRDLGTRPFQMQLINAEGISVLKKQLYNALEQVNVKQLPTGTYTLLITNRNGIPVANKKVIIAR
jgi:aldose sugar dehydrogenase